MIDGIRGGIVYLITPPVSPALIVSTFLHMYNTYRQYLSVNAVHVFPRATCKPRCILVSYTPYIFTSFPADHESGSQPLYNYVLGFNRYIVYSKRSCNEIPQSFHVRFFCVGFYPSDKDGTFNGFRGRIVYLCPLSSSPVPLILFELFSPLTSRFHPNQISESYNNLLGSAIRPR